MTTHTGWQNPPLCPHEGTGSTSSWNLQRDWVALGPESFAFEVLDTLEPVDDPEYDPSGDLRELEDLWVQKLEAEGATRYT